MPHLSAYQLILIACNDCCSFTCLSFPLPGHTVHISIHLSPNSVLKILPISLIDGWESSKENLLGMLEKLGDEAVLKNALEFPKLKVYLVDRHSLGDTSMHNGCSSPAANRICLCDLLIVTFVLSPSMKIYHVYHLMKAEFYGSLFFIS